MHWLDVEDIAEALLAAHPSRDPMRVRFTELRGLVEALAGFAPEADHPVILEAIQAEWFRLKMGLPQRED
jgi:FeS assembly protein IscX